MIEQNDQFEGIVSAVLMYSPSLGLVEWTGSQPGTLWAAKAGAEWELRDGVFEVGLSSDGISACVPVKVGQQVDADGRPLLSAAQIIDYLKEHGQPIREPENDEPEGDERTSPDTHGFASDDEYYDSASFRFDGAFEGWTFAKVDAEMTEYETDEVWLRWIALPQLESSSLVLFNYQFKSDGEQGTLVPCGVFYIPTANLPSDVGALVLKELKNPSEGTVIDSVATFPYRQ